MESCILSKQGTRKLNEDYVGQKTGERGFCCALADGLGGHDRGEVASKLVVETCLELFESPDEHNPERYITHSFEEGQKRLLMQQKASFSEMKTTLAILCAMDGQIQWGHVGDSRLYYFKDGKLVFQTADHSVPQMLVRTGEIRAKDIRGHEDRNRLLKVMGIPWNRPAYEIAPPVEVRDGQAFLLCSDGFWEWIEENQMVRALKHAETPEEWLQEMETLLLKKAGGKEMDNYSAAGIFIGTRKRRKRFFVF